MNPFQSCIVSDRRFGGSCAARALLSLAAAPLVFAVSLAGCSAGETPHVAAHDDDAPITIRVASPSTDDALASLIVPGRVKASEEVTLTARVTARLTSLPTREGDAFAKGDVLARFDAPETQDALRSARQRVTTAEARLKQATSDEDRFEKLYASRVVAARDLELAQLARASAEAELADARAERQRWEESTALRAPFRGVVARRHVDPGQTVSPGQPLLDLRAREVGEIEAAIPESALPRLESAVASYQTDDRDWRPARLVRVDGMTDYATRTRRAHFAPIDASGLEPGAFARLRLVPASDAEHPAVTPAAFEAGRGLQEATGPLSVPSRALVRRGALTGVYVVRDDRAWLRWLRVGRESEGRTEVLAGLSPDDLVVMDPAHVTDGQPVQATP